MVVKKRLRAVLIPLALYGVSGLAVGYFVHHAQSGQRGLEAKRELQIERERIAATLDALTREREDWEHRIALVRAEQIDRDLLEEQARLMLGRVHANDVVIMLGPAADAPAARAETSIN
ncbi:FtsB family cell division protein [Salinarimonas rosea]|uniref:FtsB family cell division protein n=1 Tax=Salinarimonas rosea TaxID=552063 RepID=UPI0004156138|nr:septum formation initiator family protein [Salinarimonas rosea]